MRRDDSLYLIENQKKAARIFKMTKTRTAMFLVMVVSTCALIFSITDAYPTPEPEIPEDLKLGNNSRLVITHVVKTIEFEVGVMDDDGIEDENSTLVSSDGSEFYETNIQLLNLDLLKEVVNQADEEGEKREETMKSSTETVSNEEKTEQEKEQEKQMDVEGGDNVDKSTTTTTS